MVVLSQIFHMHLFQLKMIVFAPDFSFYFKYSSIEKYRTFLYNLNFQEHSSIIPDLSNVLMVQLNLLGFSPDLKFILKNQKLKIYSFMQFKFSIA